MPRGKHLWNAAGLVSLPLFAMAFVFANFLEEYVLEWHPASVIGSSDEGDFREERSPERVTTMADRIRVNGLLAPLRAEEIDGRCRLAALKLLGIRCCTSSNAAGPRLRRSFVAD